MDLQILDFHLAPQWIDGGSLKRNRYSEQCGTCAGDRAFEQLACKKIEDNQGGDQDDQQQKEHFDELHGDRVIGLSEPLS